MNNLTSTRADTFKTRSELHDSIAKSVVDRLFSAYGYSGFPTGIERHERECWRFLYGKNDYASLITRYYPDRIYVSTDKPSILCEIKVAPINRPNFAIEFDSFYATKVLSRAVPVLYVLVDVDVNRKSALAKAAWSHQLPIPDTVYVPNRYIPGVDVLTPQQKAQQIRNVLPSHCRVQIEDKRGGSGTPYFLLPKSSGYLKPLRALLHDISQN